MYLTGSFIFMALVENPGGRVWLMFFLYNAFYILTKITKHSGESINPVRGHGPLLQNRDPCRHTSCVRYIRFIVYLAISARVTFGFFRTNTGADE